METRHEYHFGRRNGGDRVASYAWHPIECMHITAVSAEGVYAVQRDAIVIIDNFRANLSLHMRRILHAHAYSQYMVMV